LGKGQLDPSVREREQGNVMNVIYKYAVGAGGASYEFPVGYKILSVGAQAEEICVWVEHSVEAQTTHRSEVEFTIIPTGGTGHEEGSIGNYVGTVLLFRGSLVFHIFAKEVVQ
jgi:hypothetical protein